MNAQMSQTKQMKQMKSLFTAAALLGALLAGSNASATGSDLQYSMGDCFSCRGGGNDDGQFASERPMARAVRVLGRVASSASSAASTLAVGIGDIFLIPGRLGAGAHYGAIRPFPTRPVAPSPRPGQLQNDAHSDDGPDAISGLGRR